MVFGGGKEKKSLVLHELKCPECQGLKIRRRSTFSSFSLTLGVFFVIALLLYLGLGAELFRLRVFIVLTAIFSFGAVLAAGMSVLFGRNRCKECGHRWR